MNKIVLAVLSVLLPCAVNAQHEGRYVNQANGTATNLSFSGAFTTSRPALVRTGTQSTGLLPLLAFRGTVIDNLSYNSFPSLLVDTAGRWQVFYRSGTDHLSSADGTIRQAISSNNGGAWTTGTITTPTGDARDPRALQMASGTILLTATINASGTNTIYKATSTDRGTTFTAFSEIPNTFNNGEFVGGEPIQLPDATILLPVYGYLSGTDTRTSTAVMRSVDQGSTWTQITIISEPVTVHHNECSLVYYPPSNSVIAFIRNESSAILQRSVSSDGGLTWGALTTVTPASWAAGSPDVCYIGGAIHLLYRASSATRRATSWDAGATWSTEAFESSTFEYSSTKVLSDGSLLTALALEVTSTNCDIFLRSFRLGVSNDPAGVVYGEQFLSERSDATVNPFMGLAIRGLSLPNLTAITFNNLKDSTTIPIHAWFAAVSNTYGGAGLNGLTTSTEGALPVFISGKHGDTTPTAPSIVMQAVKTNGTTGQTAIASGELAVEIRNNSTVVASWLGDGTYTNSGTTQSVSKDTGAILTEGGIGVEKNASIGGNLTVSGTSINFANLPTVEPATVGDLWIDTGVVKVSDGP